MPVQINELVIEVPPPSNAPSSGGGAAAAGAPSPWTAELARKVDQQLRLAVERQHRLVTD